MNEPDQQEFRLRTLEFNIEQLQLKSNETFIVNTDCGKIKGVKRRTIYGDNYYSFERIPYGQPPVSELRFQAPRPVTPWQDVLDCTHYGPKSVQLNPVYDRIEGSEDCLYLNVYTNKLAPTKKLRAVMVWIHGGGYNYGEATREWYGPDYFMKKDVMLVTIQYRLGALGFLSLCGPHLQIPGNAGLKDQILALRWIKRNCPKFGGNPDCITIFGESAGAESTHLLMLSEQTRGLFHRAIIQSGAANADWAISDSAKRSFALAQAAGYTGENKDRDILEFLLSCSAEQITKAKVNCLTAEDRSNIDLMAFGPTLEPYMTSHTVLTQMPSDLLATTWSNEIPLLVGATSKEGLSELPAVKRDPGLVEQAMKTCAAFVPRSAAPDGNSQDRLEKGLKLRRIHVAAEKATADEYYDIFSHKFFWHPIATIIRARLKHVTTSSSTSSSPAPTYLYRFDFDSDKLINPCRLLREGRGVTGVGHGDDCSILFSNVLSCRMAADSREYRTVERMIGLWTKFAETGNPNVGNGEINGMKGIEWQALQKDDAIFKCLNISDEIVEQFQESDGVNPQDLLEFIELPEMAKINVWQSLNNDEQKQNKQTAGAKSYVDNEDAMQESI